MIFKYVSDTELKFITKQFYQNLFPVCASLQIELFAVFSCSEVFQIIRLNEVKLRVYKKNQLYLIINIVTEMIFNVL